MAGTTRLELATSAVTVHTLRMHLSAEEGRELRRRIRIRSESTLSSLHYAAQKRIALRGVERQGYDTEYVTEKKTVLVIGYRGGLASGRIGNSVQGTQAEQHF
jgi:hypothetical protein